MPLPGSGGWNAVGPTSGGKVYAFNNLTSTPQVIAPSNSKRTSITFDNPGSVDIVVFPTNVQALNPSWTTASSIDGNTSISNAALTPSTAALGGGYRIYANGGTKTITGECQGAYQALAISGTGNALTVTDSNV